MQGTSVVVSFFGRRDLYISSGADYLIWKIERHSGVKVGLTDAQRKHPIWAGITTFWRMYRQGAFR